MYIPWGPHLQEGTEYERYCHAVVSPGVAIVNGMPEDLEATGKVVSDAVFGWFGKLMQHPERDTNHWLISSTGYSAKVGSFLLPSREELLQHPFITLTNTSRHCPARLTPL